MIPKTQSDSKLPALWECTGASLGFHVFIHATGKARSGQTDSALREYLNTDTTKARQFLERHVGKIVMEPAGKGYVASGTWDLLGGNQIRWDGAEGQS